MAAKGQKRVDNVARRNIYIEHRIAGVIPTQAARLAGAKNPREYAHTMEQHPEVRDIVASAIQNARLESRYTREGVLEVIDDAIHMAKIIADPASMIRGAQEINKMQGYYAPETKELVFSDDATKALNQIAGLSEKELLDRLGKDDAYIDADFEELPDNG